jgi:hypothetical protein
MASLRRTASMYTTRSSARSTTNKENQAQIKSAIDKNKIQKPLTKIKPLINNENFNKTTAGKSSAAKTCNPALNKSLTDFTCPICLEILVEPVQMPCNHELCLPCFKTITDKVNLLCPMCRLRISSWSRANANSLVNKERWKEIQTLFPKEIKDRLEGKTAIRLSQELKEKKFESTHPLTKPGEIRKEYEEYVRRENERIRMEKEQEEKKSLEFIEKIMKEEQNLSLNEYVNLLNAENSHGTRHMKQSKNVDSLNKTSCISISKNQSNILRTSNLSLNSSNISNSSITSTASNSCMKNTRDSSILNSKNLRPRYEHTYTDDSIEESEITLSNTYNSNENLQASISLTSPRAYQLRSKRTNSKYMNNSSNELSVGFDSQSNATDIRAHQLNKRRRT